MGKGDNRRPSSVSKEEYDNNFEAIFGKKKLNLMDQEEDNETTTEPVPPPVCRETEDPDQNGGES
jgi:hypothetical protein